MPPPLPLTLLPAPPLLLLLWPLEVNDGENEAIVEVVHIYVRWISSEVSAKVKWKR